MQNQWNEYDEQLDKLFADSDFNMQKDIIEMYENEYAGTQTGATAARKAGQSAKALGFANAKRTADLILNQEELARKKKLLDLELQIKLVSFMSLLDLHLSQDMLLYHLKWKLNLVQLD